MDLTVKPGEQLAIIGPSGAGKTTLLHLLGGLETPDAGEIFVDGKNLRDFEPGQERSRLVGVMHQQFDLVDQLSVANNVLAGRLGEWGFWTSLRSLFTSYDHDLARRALERVGIPDKINEKTAHLSGGEQQRVALARLLVQHPEIVLADEPIASVDPARGKDLLKILRDIAAEENLTLIVSLHSVDLAREFFPRIVGMRRGSIQFDRSTENLTENHLDELYELDENGTHEEAAVQP